MREVKIYKVIKGDITLDTMKVGEAAALVEESTGKELIVIDGVVPMQKGCKYIIFLKKSNVIDDYFIAGVDEGKYNIDDKDTLEKRISNLKDEALAKYDKEIH